jgi:hypothetical protein
MSQSPAFDNVEPVKPMARVGSKLANGVRNIIKRFDQHKSIEITNYAVSAMLIFS